MSIAQVQNKKDLFSDMIIKTRLNFLCHLQDKNVINHVTKLFLREEVNEATTSRYFISVQFFSKTAIKNATKEVKVGKSRHHASDC